jgi:queuine tRNA-ribosyltransferase
MGVGAPEDVVNGVLCGVDMFDCVLPTRLARNGSAFIVGGRINLRNEQFKQDRNPVMADCTCYTCRHFSRAYVRHLVTAKEILASILLTIHNVHFLIDLMQQIRQAIGDGRFSQFAAQYLRNYSYDYL